MAHITLYFLALFSLSTSPNWAKLNHMDASALGFYRMLGAVFLLLVYLTVAKKLQKFKMDASFGWALTSAVLFFLHLWTYHFAAKHTLIANTTILFATNPVWASLGGQIFFKENIKPRVMLSYVLAAIGVFILVAQNLKLTAENNWGNISALVTAFFYAAFMLTSKKARLHMRNEDYALIQYSVAAVLFLLVTLVTDTPFSGYDSTSWWAVLGMIVFPTFLGHFAFTYLVKHMNLSLMTCGKLLEPIIATIIAYFLFKEQLGPNAFIAFGLTGFSVVILFWPTLVKTFKA